MPDQPTVISAQPNPLDKATYGNPQGLKLNLTDEQTKYQGYKQARMTRAQEQRDRSWPEFSGKTYLAQFQENEDIANTRIMPVKNEDETPLATGTIESKLGTLLSNISALNITPEVLAFSQDDVPLTMLGVAITDVMDRCDENDGGTDGGGDEKKMLRQKELLKQGTVFVQDRWANKYQMKKKLKGVYDGKFEGTEWDSIREKVFSGPDRTLLYAPNVYLGDVTAFSMDDQPYAFTIETMDYDVANGLYGDFENFKYVRSGMPPPSTTTATLSIGGRTIYDAKFRMGNLDSNQVEVIKYQDPTRDEFAIDISGVPMLPMGFPLSAVTPGGKFNIAKQVLYPINPQFAYGKSFVSSGDVYQLSRLLDEILGLFILKTRKSITPAWINTTNKVISKRSLSPGNITMGLPPNPLVPIGNDGQGVTAGEFSVYNELMNRINNSTVSPVFQGQFSSGTATATEVLQVQQQAKLSLGIIIFACTLLEVKLAYIRLPIILDKYFEPTGVKSVNGNPQKQYRSVSRNVPIENAGMGVRRVIPTAGALPTKDATAMMEQAYEKATGTPLQIINVSVQKIQQERVTWRCVANPKQKESSAYDKVVFKDMVDGVLGLVNIGAQPNIAGLETEFARVHGVDRNKIFSNPAPTQVQNPALADIAQRTRGDMAAGNSPNAAGAPTVSPAMKSVGTA